MFLSETDIEVVKLVVQEFVASKKSTPRRPLIIKARSGEVLDRLVRWSVLSSVDHQTYLPRALAFHFCENKEALRLAKQSVETVASVLIALFPDSTEDRFFPFEEIETQARRMFGAIDRQTVSWGLYFAPEFNLLAGWRGDQAKMESVRIGEPVVQIEHPEALWDGFVKQRTDWIEKQATGNWNLQLGQADHDDANLATARPSLSVQISQKIFLVHGHDDEVRKNVARFLRERLGLEVVILHERPNRGRTIIEKVEANSDVSFAVVILTPDDVGATRKNKKRLQKRARQNVILELGYFIGKLGRERVTALYVKDVELPSDFDGVLYIAYDSPGEWRGKLAKEIDAAGIEVDLAKFQTAGEHADRDELTGLLNRKLFDEAVLAEYKRSKRAKTLFSTILLDLDNFKPINDTYGHTRGDKLIKRVALVLDQMCSRDQTLSRYGGDEFALLAPGLNTQQAHQLAERFRSALVTDIVLKRKKVTGSFGVASYPRDALTLEELLRVAGERVSNSKQVGGNRVSYTDF